MNDAAGPGQQDHPLLRRLHRDRASHRRQRQVRPSRSRGVAPRCWGECSGAAECEAVADNGVFSCVFRNQAAMNPRQTVFDAKRLIGRRFDDADVKKDMVHWPFKVIDREGSPVIEVRGGRLFFGARGAGADGALPTAPRSSTSARPSSSPLPRSPPWSFPSSARPPRPSSARPSRRPSSPSRPTSTTRSVSPPR